MRVHHINCGTMCPPLGRWIRGEGSLFSRAKMVCHCLLVETEQGLVLIDTGLGRADIAQPRERLGRNFPLIVKPMFDPEETAHARVQALGFRVEDVRHIVVTHLDLDHAGGLSDFPHAKVHLYRPEHHAAMERATLPERERYRPLQWAHGPAWRPYDTEGEPWFGFSCVRQLEGLPPEILIVPVTGHTRGHAAIAVAVSAASLGADSVPWSQRRDVNGGADPGDTAPRSSWLLHCGDAYFYRGEMDPTRRTCPAGLDVFQKLLAWDDRTRRANQERLRELAKAHAGEVRLFSAHDEVELQKLQDPAAAA